MSHFSYVAKLFDALVCYEASDVLSVERDMKYRGRQLEQILHQYMTFVKPAFEEFCQPVSCHSSLLVNAQ